MAMARVIAQRSLCDRDKVGAVVVDRNNRIVDTGYNGPPAGWKRSDKLLEAYPDMGTSIEGCAKWCPRAMTPAQLGIPTGVSVMRDPSYNDCPSLHAEANALMFSDRRHREGGTIYVSSGTCGGCAKLVANSGLATAVYAAPITALHRNSQRWYDFLESCGVTVVTV